ncbi:MAG: hypothetical protein ABUJ92_00005, partial [Desulfobacterales bacterium]
SVTSEDTSPFGIAFNATGTKMYIVGDTNDSVFQYSEPNDLLRNVLMRTVAPVTSRYFRFKIVNEVSAINISVLWLGEHIITNSGLAIGSEPLYAAQRFHPVDSVTQDGEFVGRSIKERPIKGIIKFVPVQTEAYIRGEYMTMLRAIEQHPFFVIPYPNSYPMEVYYCWTNTMIPKARYTQSLYLGADIPIFAKVS